MLTSIKQVDTEFYKLFYKTRIVVNGVEKTIPLIYARQSSYDYSEAQPNQTYPCIAVQNYTPTPKEEWFIDMHPYFGGRSMDGIKAYLYQRPIWMNFRYDVSIVSKGYSEYMAMQQLFLTKFVYGKRFVFDKRLTGEAEVGDIVAYTVRQTDIPRMDGVLETNYEFNLAPWIYAKTPEERTDIISQIVLNMEEVNPDDPRLSAIKGVVNSL